MSSYKIISGKSHYEEPSTFAVGADTGTLYLVWQRPIPGRPGRGTAIIGKNGIPTGSNQDIRAYEIIKPGTIIEITT